MKILWILICDLPTHLSNILVSVSKAEQEVWQHVDHIRLKQFPQHVTQHLKGEQSSWTETNTWSVGFSAAEVECQSSVWINVTDLPSA